jgi:RNA ligase (TIGR02306 family)
MSAFEVTVTRISAIEPIPDADAIELAVIGDYRSVIRKVTFSAGSLAVYIPEGAIVPDLLLQALGLEGKLAGSKKNRVKAMKLRGCLSQGLVYPVDSGEDVSGPFMTLPTEDGIGTFLPVREGQNVADDLGIIKWEPPVPTNMGGEVYAAGQMLTVAFDVENFKKYPSILQDGEEVVFTEKLHGTFCGLGIVPQSHARPEHIMNRMVVFSKGLGADGLCFKDNEANVNNLYVRTLRTTGVFDRLLAQFGDTDVPVFVLGEVFGKGVQDLEYGIPASFRVFACVRGYRGHQQYFNWSDVEGMAGLLGVTTVPVLYKGPFSREVMNQHTIGLETASGLGAHIREGIVMVPTTERHDPIIGRVCLKSVAEAYLLRKGNVTEFQ